MQKHIAASLAAALLATGPAFAADAPAAMVAPPASQASAASPASEATKTANPGGVQNWRYSEFIDAVKANKVEKVRSWIDYHIQNAA